MTYLFKITIVLFYLVPFQIIAQGFSDIIKIDGEYYLIAPSLSIQQDTSKLYIYEKNQEPKSHFRGEYVMKDGEIILTRVLNNEYKNDTTKFFKPNGNYALLKINDLKRTRIELAQMKEHFIRKHSVGYKYVRFIQGVPIKEDINQFTNDDQFAYVRVHSWNDEFLDLKFQSLKSDSMIYSFDSVDVEHLQLLKIQKGTYRVTLRCVESGNYSVKEMTFEGGLNYRINLELDSYWYEGDEVFYLSESYYNSSVTSSFCNLMYGSGVFKSKGNTGLNSYLIQLGFSQMNYTGNTFFHSIGGYIAGSYSTTFIPNSLSLSPQKKIIEQHFSYLSYDLGILTNIHLNKYRGRKVWRPVIEMGVEYSLPLIFRYISRDLVGKYSERWIHKFNDLKITGRIGFQNGISITGSYRFFNIVNNRYPQMSKLQFGLSFPINRLPISSAYESY